MLLVKVLLQVLYRKQSMKWMAKRLIKHEEANQCFISIEASALFHIIIRSTSKVML